MSSQSALSVPGGWGTTSAALALVVFAVAVQGATTWTSETSLGVEATAPPITFEKGETADDERWFRSFELSAEETAFTAEVKPRGGAHVTIEDVVRLNSTDDEPRTVRLTGTAVTNDEVEVFAWTIRDGGSALAELDHKEADPSASVEVPAGDRFAMDLEIDLADGAGRTNAGISFEIQLEVT